MTRAVRSSGTSLAWVALCVSITLWSLAPPGVRAAVGWYAPGQLALLRCLAASAALAVYAAIHRIGPPSRADAPRVALIGLACIVGFHLCVNHALVRVPAAVTSVLTETSPVFTALAAVLFLRERLTAAQWAGIVGSLAGVAIIAAGQWKQARLGVELMLPLAGALSWTAGTALQKPVLRRVGPQRTTIYMIWAGTLFLMPYAPGLPAQVARAPLSATLGLIALGIGPLALAYTTWAYALSRLDASVATVAFYLIPVMVAGIGWVWLHETPSATTIAGSAVVIAGVALVQLSGRARMRANTERK